jgi:hypothetical protein
VREIRPIRPVGRPEWVEKALAAPPAAAEPEPADDLGVEVDPYPLEDLESW